MSNVIGPDVSFYQDDPETPQGINFARMSAAAQFVILRAGQNTWVDPDFKYNWRESKKAGLKRGCYWFYDSRANPKRQAETWFGILEGDLGELPLFADFEENFKGPYSGWGKWYDFLEELRGLAGSKEIAIYTSYYYWRDHAPSPLTRAKNLDFFHQYPLWIAHYKTARPSIPKPWGSNEWLFWQFTESAAGSQYGVESNAVDLNYFNGEHSAFLTRFPDGPAGPPPAPAPKPGAGTKHRVIVAVLRVRSGPEMTFSIIGRLERDEIVEELAANPERTWIKVRAESDLEGWVSNDYLVIEVISPAPAFPPPPQPTGRKYRLGARLKILAGPGKTYSTVAILEIGEIVEEVGSTSDRVWLQVRRRNGLTGWAYSEFLLSLDQPEPRPPQPQKTEAVDWYRITASTLSVGAEPMTGASSLGSLKKEDILPALQVSTDQLWIKVRRVDGLTGWVSSGHAVRIGNSKPAQLKQNLSAGVNYYRREFQSPRVYVAHILAIDLKAAAFAFIITPPQRISGVLCTQTVSEFLEAYQVDIAINGDGFSYLQSTPGAESCAQGDPVAPNGFAASRGRIYSERGGATVYFSRNHVLSINQPMGSIYNAVSGDRIILGKGKLVENLATNLPNPRTAFGLSENGRVLILAVVDGRQPGYSEGVTFPELADLLLSFGAYTGINMDGGGSSTLVIKGVDGGARVLNSPIDQTIPGKERAVANHLGLTIKK